MLVRWIGLSFLFLVTGTAQAQEVDAARRFGTLPGVTQVSLSPDGQRIAFVAPNKGQANDLYVVEIADGAAPRRILRASGEPETLRWGRWSSNARILCPVDRKGVVKRTRVSVLLEMGGRRFI